MNEKLLSGPDLLRSLVETALRFRENQIASSADTEFIELQIPVPKEKCRVLRFLWCDKPDDNMGVFEYNRHVFGEK